MGRSRGPPPHRVDSVTRNLQRRRAPHQVSVPVATYQRIAEYAQRHGMTLGQVVDLATCPDCQAERAGV